MLSNIRCNHGLDVALPDEKTMKTVRSVFLTAVVADHSSTQYVVEALSEMGSTSAVPKEKTK